MSQLILTCNAGSNSLKCALCEVDGETFCYYFTADNIHDETTVTITDKDGRIELENEPIESGYENALSFFYGWFEENIENCNLVGAGHRIVHGGQNYSEPVQINSEVRTEMENLVPFAPLHQPYNLKLVDILDKKIPGVPQIACFDTAFHQKNRQITHQFALPRDLVEKEGLYRYGFHGLSYEYITGALPGHIDNAHQKKIVAVHLGSGASACAIKQGKSIDTTMGFSALDGLMMATRCGRLDPGVVLYLLQQKNMQPSEIEELLYKKSGLLGVSGISADMRDLEDNPDENARQAVDLFCYMAAKEIGGLIPSLGGIDVLVFTGAMGKNSAIIRRQICNHLSWLSLELDENANNNDSDLISNQNSAIEVLALATNEEAVIARNTARTLGSAGKSHQKRKHGSPH